jgi:hypothetical protein
MIHKTSSVYSTLYDFSRGGPNFESGWGLGWGGLNWTGWMDRLAGIWMRRWDGRLKAKKRREGEGDGDRQRKMGRPRLDAFEGCGCGWVHNSWEMEIYT